MELRIDLPASKSESNRALIIKALAYQQSGVEIKIDNLSEANDTKVLQKMLESLHHHVFDAEDAGTAFRFMTAYLAVSTVVGSMITGTPRMQERPVGILVEALRALGANIAYVGKEGFPPLKIGAFQQKTNTLAVQANVSSQFVSALLLVAPCLPDGLRLRLVGKVSSKPYIEMTLRQMTAFGISIEADWGRQEFYVPRQRYQARICHIENDWSAASYWYSAFALSKKVFKDNNHTLFLERLFEDSRQGDSIIAELMVYWGVATEFVEGGGVILSHVSPALPADRTIDFTDFPDLAQTILPLVAGRQGADLPTWRFKGLESLRIKETDRIQALQQALAVFGFDFYEEDKGIWALRQIPNFVVPPTFGQIETYHDHRMVMGFAPFLMWCDFTFTTPEAVRKSYPNFWEEWEKFQGFFMI